MAYSDKVIDHYENPRNVGSFEKGDNSVGTGMVGAPACGDVMKLQIRVNDQGVIEDAKFKTYGCGSAIASSSLVTEWVKGKTLDQALEIKNSLIAEELALPPVKIHCSILAEDAIKAALNPAEGDWLTVSDQQSSEGGAEKLEIRFAMAHPFMVLFAQTDPSNIEALIRVGCAIAVSEKLARRAGVKLAGTIRRNVNEILREALSRA